MNTLASCIPPTAARPNEPGAAFEIFSQGSKRALSEEAHRKGILGGHPRAFAPDSLGGGGVYAATPDLARLLGGESAEADRLLPPAILKQLGINVPDGAEQQRAAPAHDVTPLRHILGGITPTRSRAGGLGGRGEVDAAGTLERAARFGGGFAAVASCTPV